MSAVNTYQRFFCVSIITSLLLPVAAISSLAGVIRHDRFDTAYTSRASSFPSVGQLTFTDDVGDSFIGSAVLITPNWALTAAHCVDGALVTQTLTIGGNVHNVDFRTPHENWTGDLFAGFDIGLVHLSTAVSNVEPAFLYAGKDEVGSVATSVGFGLGGNGLTGAIPPPGIKRAGDNMIDAMGGQITTTGNGSSLSFEGISDRILLVDFDNPLNSLDSAMGSTQPLDLEMLIAPGDSGGGAAFLTVNAQAVVSGVHSFGFSIDGLTNSDYGDIAGYTRVSSFIDWILEVITPGPPGDYNANGVVDAADYVVWRKSLGSSTRLQNEVPGVTPGQITQEDDAAWQERFGNTEQGASRPFATVVPEPGSLLLVLIAAGLVSLKR